MMLRAIFDEKRRKEISDAIEKGALIEFRKRPPITESGGIGRGIPIGEIYPIHEKLSRILGKHYGTARYQSALLFGIDSGIASARILGRMAKARADAEGIEREEEAEIKEEEGKNQ